MRIFDLLTVRRQVLLLGIVLSVANPDGALGIWAVVAPAAIIMPRWVDWSIARVQRQLQAQQDDLDAIIAHRKQLEARVRALEGGKR